MGADIIHRNCCNGFINIFTAPAVFFIDYGSKLGGQIFRQLPQFGDTLAVGLGNIKKVLCLAVLTEYGNAVFPLVYKPA